MPPRKRIAKPTPIKSQSSAKTAAAASPHLKSARSSTVDLSSFFSFVDTDPLVEEFDGPASANKSRSNHTNHTHSQSTTNDPTDDEIEVRYVEKQNLDTLNSAVCDLQAIVRAQNEQLGQQHRMLQQISAQLAAVSADLGGSGNSPTPPPPPPQRKRKKPYAGRTALPVNTFQELLAFEHAMNEPEFKAYLMTIGGSTVLRMVHNIVGAMYTFAVQSGTTWRGKRTPDGRAMAKPALCNTRMPAIIVDVCLAHFPQYTQEEVWTMFKKYMVHATDRQRRSQQQRQLETGAKSDNESSEE